MTACAVEQVGIDPPRKESNDEKLLFYPTGLALHPGDRWLYVTNGNADLRYNHGTLSAIDLDELPPDPLEPNDSCPRNPIGPARTSCKEAELITEDLLIGDFAGEIEIRGDDRRLYFPTRGDPPTVTWVGLRNDGTFDVDDDEVQTSRVTDLAVSEDATVSLPSEPFGMTLLEGCPGSEGARLLVTHLSTGVVSMIEECDGEPTALAVSDVLFPQDRIGRRRAYAIAPRVANDCEGYIYVTSSTSSRVAMLLVETPDVETPDMGRCFEPQDVRLLPGPSFGVAPPLDDELSSRGREQNGTDSRGIAFAPDGNRAWIASREPPSLILVDTSEEDGLPRNRPRGVVEVCPEPSVVKHRQEGTRTLVYVVCFATSEIYVVDGDTMTAVDVIQTGRGPASLEFDGSGQRAFVAHFAENTIGEVDLDPASPYYHRMVRTIGLPDPLLE